LTGGAVIKMIPCADFLARRRIVGLRKIRRKVNRFTSSRGVFDREHRGMIGCLTAIGLTLGVIAAAAATATGTASAGGSVVLAQAMVPPSGMEEKKPMTPAERMQARFPQPMRVGDLIGLPILDDSSCTLGHVREVVRTPDDKIELVVSYGGFFGWGARPVAVPIEVVGIQGRELASLDMSRSEYAAAPSWRNAGAQRLPDDATIKIALARR
jgi:PRC-barrel domain